MKRAIPPVPTSEDYAVTRFNRAVKEQLEVLSGVRRGRVEPLPADAALGDVITAINQIINKLQE
jgi:Zn-finger domain-containing protein